MLHDQARGKRADDALAIHTRQHPRHWNTVSMIEFADEVALVVHSEKLTQEELIIHGMTFGS